MSDGPLGSFEEQVLLAILRAGDDAYGMGVRRAIEEATGRDLSIGAVYATLDRLEEKGLIESYRGSAAGTAARRFFRVLPAGAEALAESRRMRDALWEGIDLDPLRPR